MVPNYLMTLADQIKEKKDLTTFHLKCFCGCNTFLLAKSKNTENEKKQTDFNNRLKSLKWPIFSWKDAIDKQNGEKCIYGTTFFGIKLVKFYVKDLPDFNIRHIIKAKCSRCGTEFVIFDSLYHGYDALTENKQETESNELTIKFVWTNNPKEIIVNIRTDISYEEFAEEFGENKEMYSNAFESIDIYTINSGRKKLFFDEETA